MSNLPSINQSDFDLNLPQYPLEVKTSGAQELVFDKIRKKYVVLTPEEWVRQHFLNYLIYDLTYPKSLIRIESGLVVNNLGKRTDIVVYNQAIEPFLLVECKASRVHLNEKAMEQLAIYNRTMKAEFLVLTNGLKHYCCKMDYDSGSYQFQSELPPFENSSLK
jgi:hypothetical protein